VVTDTDESDGPLSERPTPRREFDSTGARFRQPATEHRGVARALGEAVDLRWRLLPVWSKLPSGGLRSVLRDHSFSFAGRRLPVIRQVQDSDCGPAALTMVLNYFGIPAALDDVRNETDSGRDGVSARILLDTARQHGLVARGLRVSIGGLKLLPRASILFWNFTHFIVLEKVSGSYLYAIDPAHGRRRIPMSDVDKSFTGIAIEFEANANWGVPRVSAHTVFRPEGMRRWLPQFFPRCSAWLPVIGASLVLVGFSLAAPLVSDYVVDRAGKGIDPSLALISAATLLISYFWIQAVRGVAILSLQTIGERRVTENVLSHLLSLPFSYFTRRNPGDLAMRVRTATGVRQVLTGSALSSIFDGLLVIVYGILGLLLNARLALIILILALAQVGLLVGSWRRQEYLVSDALEAQSKAQGELVEILEEIATVKASGIEVLIGEKWSHALADELQAQFRSRRFLAWYSAASTGLQFSAPICVLLYGSILLSEGRVSLGEVVGFTSLAAGVFVPLASLTQAGLQVAGLSATFARLADVVQAPPEDGIERERVTKLDGTINMRDICFTYDGSQSLSLRDVTLDIAEGQFVAFLGRSGSGKSTLAMIVAGLNPPSKGQVLIGGHELSEVNRQSLRQSLAFVNQNTRLFAGTIRENITIRDPDSSMEYVEKAAKLAELHDEIISMPMGYETMVGVGGAGLSGGQAQRVALARALLRESKIVVLDEATSALDRVTEQKVFENIRALGCTLVVVAHRLSVIEEADQIIVMQDGRIFQKGRHVDLLELTGPYQKLIGVPS
jgi:ATP-binding cassette subfamily B protein